MPNVETLFGLLWMHVWNFLELIKLKSFFQMASIKIYQNTHFVFIIHFARYNAKYFSASMPEVFLHLKTFLMPQLADSKNRSFQFQQKNCLWGWASLCTNNFRNITFFTNCEWCTLINCFLPIWKIILLTLLLKT